jgi:hypothetical protein
MKFGAHYLPTYIPNLDGPAPEFYRRMFAQMEELDRLGFVSAGTVAKLRRELRVPPESVGLANFAVKNSFAVIRPPGRRSERFSRP